MHELTYCALAVVGCIGQFAALGPFIEELEKVVEREQVGPATTLWQRRNLLRWAVPVIVFGIAGVIGLGGLMVYIAQDVIAS